VEGIPTEVFMGDPKAGMKDQLSHANAREIPVAVLLGPDELSEGKISVKNLIVGKEQREGIGDRDRDRRDRSEGGRSGSRRSWSGPKRS
jgi:histidyl-tRNA synthetase